MRSATRYDHAATAARRAARPGDRDDRELIRLATLAASSHNTQPWLFEPTPDAIVIHPDRDRRCPVVDADDAHLYRSLGCAAENMIHAASLQHLAADATYDDTLDAVVVRLTPDPARQPSDLAAALTTRQCTRATYDGRPLHPDHLEALLEAGTGTHVTCEVRTNDADLGTINELSGLVEAGNRAQLGDRAFRSELVDWLRFNPSIALRRRDGLAGRVNGQPPLPTPVGRLLAPLVIRADAQVRLDRERIATSAGVAAFITDDDDTASWIETGRCFERFALRADLLGVRTAFINQPIEVAELRSKLATALRTTGRPQLLVRFGYAPYAPYSLRRPIDDVVTTRPMANRRYS
ncbi:MAG TPA: hypothetical protein VFZ83_14620 [Acidimicrobiia bacterium]|nr:hypothetical protein [Acidimicrobiia bacterium]